MTTKQEDVVQALAEDIDTLLKTITELKDATQYVYFSDQISITQQKHALPVVIFNYAGMRLSNRHHEIFFDLYLVAKAESNSQVTDSPDKLLATELLQRIRKAMGCEKPQTAQQRWVLESELPDFGVDDRLIYRQRWMTTYQIIR